MLGLFKLIDFYVFDGMLNNVTLLCSCFDCSMAPLRSL